MERVTAVASERAQARAARALADRGLRPGDRLAVLLPGSAGWLALVLGALRTGVVPVLLDPSSTPRERAVLLTDAEPTLVVADPAALAALTPPDGPAADLGPFPLARPMHYTSGTTGRSKGVWSGVLAEPDAAALVAEERELWGFDRADVNVVLSPLHHSAPLRFAAGTLLAGGTVLLPGRFDAQRVLDVVAAARPTTAFCVPAHLQRLFAAIDSRGGADLSSFRLLAHAGAPCPEPVKRRALAQFPRGSVWEFYGSTEGQITACPGEQWLARPGTVGRARPGRVVSVDADGLVWCAVPPYARFSYWRDPQRTAVAWRGDAFTVRDLGRLDPAGYLFLDGRREDLVISGGVNVYPVEVEQVLAGCPGVREVAVYGVPDERWGQRVCAAVVGDATESTLRDWARERLAPAKRPKVYVRLDALPRTSTGKVRRLDLAAS